jgi:uncharacterized protein (DUF885 family)
MDDTKIFGKSDSAFIKLSGEFITGYLAWRPQTGTYLGLHEYDGKVTNYSMESINAEIQRLKKYEKELSAIDTNHLSSKVFYDYKILIGAIKSEIFDFEVRQGYKKNPMSYAGVIGVDIYIKRNFAPLEDRVKSIIAIEKQAPKIYENARKNLNDSLPKTYIQTAIAIAKGTSSFLGKDLLIALKDVKNDALMKEFTDANNNAIKEINSYADFLEKEKLPKANTNFALGRENYRKLLEGEMIELEPEKILEIGMTLLKQEQKAFEETAKKIDPNKKAIDVYKEIQKDHPTAASLIPDAQKNLEAIRQFLLDKKIVTIPSDVRVKVEETPQFARATGFASMDTPGPYETKATEAYYYITPVESNWTEKQKEEWLTSFNYYTTDIVSIHEAYPGHYLQFLHLNASDASKVRKIFGSYAFVEGWAHYTEKMMVDEGFGKDKDSITAAKFRLAQLDESLLRFCRLCVSIKMHCQGMTLEEGTKFFMENCYYEEKPAQQEAIRGTFDPGYLYYTLGKLMILKLREDYKKQEGAGYTLQKFNDAFIDNGMPPVPLMREILLKDKKLWHEIL